MHAFVGKLILRDFMALKLDMTKAFDRVECCFLEGMMRRLGFSKKWIALIMRCVTSVWYWLFLMEILGVILFLLEV